MKKYIKAAGIWLLIVPLAIVNGWLRENVLVKLGNIALPLSGLLLSACIFAAACLLVPKIKKCRSHDYILFGIIWMVLTNLFDLGMIFRDGGNIYGLLQAYDFRTGNMWILVVAASAVSPYFAYRLKAR